MPRAGAHICQKLKGTPPPPPLLRGQAVPEFAYVRQIFRGWLLFRYHPIKPYVRHTVATTLLLSLYKPLMSYLGVLQGF